MRYFIGIDGGGTKTDFAIADKEGHILKDLTLGTASYKSIGLEGLLELLKEGVSTLTNGLMLEDEILSICVGLPLYGENKFMDKKLEELIKTGLKPHKVLIKNDVEVAFAGSLSLQAGIHLVAGTGSIAFGMDEAGLCARSGGWSEHFSDEGSCYWLGKKAIELFSKQADYRLERGALYDIVRKHFNIENDFDLIEIIEEEYIVSRKKTASLQLLLKEAAMQNDIEAIKAYELAAKELAMIINGVTRQLVFKDKIAISYTGGLFKNGDLILKPLKENLESEKFYLQEPKFSPVKGALLLASKEGEN